MGTTKECRDAGACLKPCSHKIHHSGISWEAAAHASEAALTR